MFAFYSHGGLSPDINSSLTCSFINL